MEIRPTRHDDLPAAYDVFRTAIGELYGRHALPAPGAPLEVFSAQQGHLVAQGGERCLVACDDGRVVAFAATLVRDDFWFLASLFVLPEHQGRGLGKRLLAAVWEGRARRRATMTDAIQPVSNGLYARRGLVPATPVLHLSGEPMAGGPSPRLEAAEPERAALADLDRAGYGFDRPADHAYWSERAHATVWLRGGEPVAYSYAWPHGQIGPLAAVDAEAGAAALGAELARCRSAAAVAVPGSCRALVESAIAAGLRFARPPGLLLLSSDAPLPGALVLSGYTLF